MIMSFATGIQTSQGDLVYLVRGKDKGQEAWHYVLVDKLKLPLFLQTVKQPSIDVSKYGEILYSGWGKNPPDDIVQVINERYGR